MRVSRSVLCALTARRTLVLSPPQGAVKAHSGGGQRFCAIASARRGRRGARACDPAESIAAQARGGVVDFPCVRQESAFARMLRERLGESVLEAVPPPSPPAGSWPAAPPHPLLFARPYASVKAGAYVCDAASTRQRRRVTSSAAGDAPQASHPQADAGPLTPAALRTPHRLTPAQHQALRTFVQLGASLDPDFTAAELRSAFRTLARRYHPDRHPATDADGRTRLTRLFASVNEQHRLLAAVHDRPAPRC